MKVGPQADKFGAFIMKKLRDEAIDYYDGLARKHWKAPGLQPLQVALATMTPEQRAVVRRCIISSVDAALHSFLFGLGEAHDRNEGIAVTVDGKNIVEQSDGLHGELFGDDGWYGRYSKHGQPSDPA